MTKTESYAYIDWLSNILREGCWVVYSSTSSNTGMNLGRIEYIGPRKSTGSGAQIQVRIYKQSVSGWSKGRLVTLSYPESAYKSVTRYFGTIPQDVE